MLEDAHDAQATHVRRRRPPIYSRSIAAALVASGLLAACLSGRTAAGAAATSCPTPAPSDAAGWQQLLDGQPYRGDGNFSTALPGGRTAWVTGDAIPAAGGPWASNTLTVVERGCARQVANTVPDADGRVFWPGPIAVVGDGLVSVGSLIRRTPGEGLGFAPIGSAIATWSLPTGGTPRLLRVAPAPSSPTGMRWSAGIAVVGGSAGTVYVWGTTDGQPGQWGVDAYVARVPARTFPGGTWRYWTGDSWSTSAAAGRPVLSAAAGNGTDTAFSARRAGDGWHLYTRRGGAWGGEHGELVGRLGGAWSWRPHGTDAGYLSSAHPEVRLASGRLLVTVNVAGSGVRVLEVAR